MSVIILTTGVPGCGKSYVRCARFLVDDFLVNTRGIHISNFPINADRIASTVCRKINKNRGIFGIFRKPVTEDDIKKRLEVIPDDVLQLWRNGLSGPWDYFKGRDLKYCHIAIDEIHNFINSRTSAEVLKQWDDFLGEIRHRGCTFEGITQDIAQVDQVLTGRASVRLELVPGEDLRDPFFKIKMSDWYELKAGFFGEYHKTVFMLEKRKQDSRWKTNHTSRFLLVPEYFQYYNSFNASLQEKEQGATDEDRAPEYEYQRRSRLSLLLWFIRRNFLTLFVRLFIALIVIWLCFGGGLTFLITSWLSVSGSMAKSNSGSSNSSTPPDKVTAAKSLEERKYLDEKKETFSNGFKPGLFFDGKCWLRNGIRIHEGYQFTNKEKHGIYYGKTVKKVDSSERFYVLDDDSVIDMF